MSFPNPRKQRQRERRLHLWRLRNLGYPLRDCVQQTAEAFGCSARQVYYDWAQRHFWLCQEYALGSMDRFNIDQIAGLLETLRQTQALAQNAQAMANPAVKLGRLKLIRQIQVDLLKFGHSAIHALMTGKNHNPFWTPSPFINELNDESLSPEDDADMVTSST